MREGTHLIFGALVGATAVGFDARIEAPEAAALALGSLLPDIDHRHSLLGKYVP